MQPVHTSSSSSSSSSPPNAVFVTNFPRPIGFENPSLAFATVAEALTACFLKPNERDGPAAGGRGGWGSVGRGGTRLFLEDANGCGGSGGCGVGGNGGALTVFGGNGGKSGGKPLGRGGGVPPLPGRGGSGLLAGEFLLNDTGVKLSFDMMAGGILASAAALPVDEGNLLLLLLAARLTEDDKAPPVGWNSELEKEVRKEVAAGAVAGE